jgi:hypothetical protein
MAYTPIIVTEDNFDWAVNENIQLILAELDGKVPVSDVARLLGPLDLNNYNLKNCPDPISNFEPVTKGYMEANA